MPKMQNMSVAYLQRLRLDIQLEIVLRRLQRLPKAKSAKTVMTQRRVLRKRQLHPALS